MSLSGVKFGHKDMHRGKMTCRIREREGVKAKVLAKTRYMGEYLTPVPSLPGLLSQEQAFPEQADSVALFPLLCIPEAWIIINSLGTTFLHLLHLALQCPFFFFFFSFLSQDPRFQGLFW